MARIKNLCHRCRHTWRLKGEHLSSACPKCGSPYVGPAPAGGIGLIGLLVLVGAALAAALYLGLIDKNDLPVDLPDVPSLGGEPDPGLAPGQKAGSPTKPGR